ncbi:MAG: DNA mismatch repair protein MutS [Lachnospiraceae bacterium]|nr:DNA mismatch repair protein MutS [Lachnospiraceae bacterium]
MVDITYSERYTDKFNALIEEKENLKKQYSMISTLRIISFLTGLGLFLIGVADDKPLALVFGIIILITFIYLVKLHGDVDKNIAVNMSEIDSADKYLKRYGNDWRNFEDDGGEFLNDEDTVARDIDLLGPNSLYQMINVCHTEYGKKLLADDLRLKNVDFESNNIRKEAISELSDKIDFAIAYEAAGIRVAKDKKKLDIKSFMDYLKDDETCILPRWANIIRILFPIAEITLIVLWALRLIKYPYPLIAFLFFLIITWLTKTVTDGVIFPLYSMGHAIDWYADMLELIETQEFSSEKLIELRDFITGENGAVRAFNNLRKLRQAYNISFNPLIHQILSGVVLWDYQLGFMVAKWKKKYAGNLSKTFEVIAEFEELLSYAVIKNVKNTSWADIMADSDNVYIDGKNMYHPLIDSEIVVDNSIELKGGVTIITGSNMSGKTTFLRTLAINLLLSYIGAPVCASKLNASYMQIFTSMRITDDVAHGISTFYAEILRIKAMAEYREKNLPMICLIDEIFKGTNSADRIVGAREAIRRLSGKKCITVVSTHDFELCELEDKDGNKAENYHFEEYYDKDELKFDYKIRDGRCETTNALAILRLAGFDVQ